MAPPPTLTAAFDFDGTLVPGDSLRPYLQSLLGRRRLARVLSTAAPAMALGYRRFGRDAAKAALLERAVAGVDAANAVEVGRTYAQRLVRRVRPDMERRIRWHRDSGHRLVLVSASLVTYLEPFAELVGFDDVIATRLAVDGTGRLTGHLDGPNVRGPEKVVRLRRLLGDRQTELWAYGDSAGDREMLAFAQHPTLVRRAPLPKL